MHYSKQDGACKMLDPLRGMAYTLDATGRGIRNRRRVPHPPLLQRRLVRSSKDGWVVVSGGAEDDEAFVLNPFTGDF